MAREGDVSRRAWLGGIAALAATSRRLYANGTTADLPLVKARVEKLYKIAGCTQPNDLQFVADGLWVLDQVDPSEHFEARRLLAREKRQSGRWVVVILEDESAHPARASQLRGIDAINRTRHVVGIGMHVDVDGAAQHANGVLCGILLTGGRLAGGRRDNEPNGERRRGHRARQTPPHNNGHGRVPRYILQPSGFRHE